MFGAQLSKIQDEGRDFKSDLVRQVTDAKSSLLEAIESQSDIQISQTESILTKLRDMQSLAADLPIQHRILRQLVFDSMESRWNQIIDAEPNTCRWILDQGFDGDVGYPFHHIVTAQDVKEAGYRRTTREGFLHWLRTGDGILHISGNAGSGKSTLVKFIGRQQRTREELEAWSGEKKLVFGQFYFWNAGASAQRTLPGLYRSILFQVLSQCPALIAKVFPTQLRMMKASRGDAAVERVQGFGEEQIQEAFHLLLQQTRNGTHRFFLIIDGLDEYEGNRLSHEALATRLKGWTAGGDVKLLVSSRPWPEFLHALTSATHPTIHLHALNRSDIRTYCFYRFQTDWEAQNMPELYEKLVKAVVHQSQGVFLWAHLVMDNLLQGIRQRDPPEVLEAKVLEAPSDLETLYDKLREPIEKSEIDRMHSNRILLLAAKNPFEFDLGAMAYSWLEDENQPGLLDPEFPTETTIQPYPEQEVARRLDRITRRINGLARGLLQVVWPGRSMYDKTPSFDSLKVQFCHRTARDYLIQSGRRYQALRDSFPQFEDIDPYGRICLAEIIYGGDSSYAHDLDDVAQRLGQSFCTDFEPKTVRKFAAPLEASIRPLWESMFTTMPINSKEVPDKDYNPRVAFVQYAAYCGFDRFVLSELAARPAQTITIPGTSILLSAYKGRSEALVRNFLEKGVGFDSLVKIYVGITRFEWPAWVLISSQALIKATRSLPETRFIEEYGLPTLRFTHQHSVTVGQPIIYILEVQLSRSVRAEEDPENAIPVETKTLCVSSTIISRLFEALLERNQPGTQPNDALEAQPQVRWTDNMKGELMVQSLKDWVLVPDGRPNFYRQLKLAGIEFNSERIMQGLEEHVNAHASTYRFY